MTLVIEDGTGKADAVSYATVETLKAYALARGEDLKKPDGGNFANADLERNLVRACDAMRGLNYVGERCYRHQSLDWPRFGVVVESFPYSSNELPRQLEQAQCAIAIEICKGTDPLPTTEANAPEQLIEQTVGEITLKYANANRVNRLPAMAKAEVLLRQILRRNGLVAIRS